MKIKKNLKNILKESGKFALGGVLGFMSPWILSGLGGSSLFYFTANTLGLPQKYNAGKDFVELSLDLLKLNWKEGLFSYNAGKIAGYSLITTLIKEDIQYLFQDIGCGNYPIYLTDTDQSLLFYAAGAILGSVVGTGTKYIESKRGNEINENYLIYMLKNIAEKERE